MADPIINEFISSPAPHLELIYFELSNSKMSSGAVKPAYDSDFYARHRINFGDIATNFASIGAGFGVERIDFSRGSRKTIQQTKGIVDGSGKLTPGSNFFVDTWWISPPKITLAGVAEMPMAKDLPICYWNENNIDNIQRKLFSFLDAMDIFFDFNSNPQKVKDDYIWLIDYNRKQHLQVTLKDFATNVSVDRPNLIVFQLGMEVLEERHTDYDIPYQNLTGTTTPIGEIPTALAKMKPLTSTVSYTPQPLQGANNTIGK